MAGDDTLGYKKAQAGSLPGGLVVKNGSKIWGIMSGEMPGPSSRIFMATKSGVSWVTEIWMWPPWGMTSKALIQDVQEHLGQLLPVSVQIAPQDRGSGLIEPRPI